MPPGYIKNIDLKIYNIISNKKKITTYILSKYIHICKGKRALELIKSILIIKKCLLLLFTLLTYFYLYFHSAAFLFKFSAL